MNDGSGSFTSVLLNGESPYLYSENGRFRKPLGIPSDRTVCGLDSADVDLDGTPDILILAIGQVYVLLNDGTAHFDVTKVFTSHQSFNEEPPKEITGMTLLDINNDGAVDIALLNDGEKFILFNDGNGNFLFDISNYSPERISQRAGDQTRHMLAADLDGDGDTDIYASNNGQANELLLNCGREYSKGIVKNSSG